MVFYRKYRPQTIDQLDSAALRETLTAVLSAKSIPHAFLFTGPKGLGKTSTARIVAKAINCEERNKKQIPRNKKDQRPETTDQIEPCNKCDQCVSITDGSNLDVMEIDAASNRGIDEIRDLREKLRLSPVSAKKKVYIIDEVHMLTTEAFNALLKSLEEPPEHVMFILCTTEEHKVPATILSRCFHIAFKKATSDELVRSFTRIASAEQIFIDEEALEYIATLSDGGFRDGVKVLEEVALLAKGEKITKELVEQKFQISNIQSQISNILKFLSEKKTKEGLEVVSQLVEQGTDMKYLIEQLISALHGQLLSELGIKNYELRTSNFTTQEIKELVTLLTRANGELKYAVLAQLPLEMVIIEWVGTESAQHLPLAASDARQPQKKLETIVPSSLSGRQSVGVDDNTKDKSGSTSNSLAGGQTQRAPKSGDDNLLGKLIDHVKLSNQSVAGLLRGSQVHSEEDEVVIEAQYKFHKEKLSEQKSMELLEIAAEAITGKKMQVSVRLREAK